MAAVRAAMCGAAPRLARVVLAAWVRSSNEFTAVDEEADHLGEALRLPPQHEHLRDELERTLRPVVNPRVAQREATA